MVTTYMRLKSLVFSLSAQALVAASCGDSGSTTAAGGATASGSTSASGPISSSSSGDAGGAACTRSPGSEDAERFVVVGHPSDAAGNKALDYEVLSLSASGTLAKLNKHFTMGRPADRPIVFSPDGKLGFAPQDDGTIGVFRVRVDGGIEVLQAAFQGSFYADRVVMSPEGDYLLVIDPDFPAVGGGIYRVDIGCDDTLTDKGRILPSKSASALGFVNATDIVMAAKEIEGSSLGDTVIRDRLGPVPSFQAGENAFGDDQAITSWLTVTHDGKFALIGDNSAASAVPNRVAFVGITANGLSAGGVVGNIEDPFAIAASPFDDAAIVVSGFGDAIFILDYKPASTPAVALRGELAYAGGKPQVPGALAMIERGVLRGRVLVSDVRGLYQVAFAPGGVVNDIGIFSLGGGTQNIVSGVGVQP